MSKFLSIMSVLGCFLLASCATNVLTKQPDFSPTQPTVQVHEPAGDGAIYSAANNRFLFEDIKARRPGDVITVLLEENTNATKSASTNTSKNTAIAMPSPTLFGMTPTYKGKKFLNNQVNSDVAFTGGADSSQSNRLTGSITVTIAEVYQNGNMFVRGEKMLTLNQGSEVVQISGIVRPADISPNNEIQSAQIADARITYNGSGALADSNKPGWLTRLVGGKLWPF